MLLPIHCYSRNNGREWRRLVKNVCSYQVLLIAIETKDVDEDRRITAVCCSVNKTYFLFQNISHLEIWKIVDTWKNYLYYVLILLKCTSI